jgi:cell division protein FtsI (penicillin-binding protein 3)
MIKKKVYFFSFLLFFLFIVAFVKLFFLQILQRDSLIKYIENQYYTSENIVLPRGIIYDCKGNILAISVPTLTVYAIPKYIKNKEKLAQELSNVLKISPNFILYKLNTNKNYVVLAKDVDKSLKEKLNEIRNELKEWNLGILESTKRVYPFNSIGANNIGFVNKYDGKGQEGLELKYDNILGGGIGKILLMKDALGNPITIISQEKKNAKNITLTIDSNIQFMAEEALKKLVEEREPKKAIVLIMNPKTGEILANAVYPSYNPNEYWKYKKFINPTFRGAYEIGSLAKPFIMAKALETGKVKENELIDGNNGKVVVDGVTIRDHARFGKLTPEKVIIHSSNVGIIKTALRFEHREFWQILKNLGFGKSTETFPGESSGILRESDRPVDIAYASIGQSWTATPIQIAVAYSAIANGGYLVKPTFIKKIGDEEEKPQIIRKVLSDENIKWLKNVLKLVVEEGTARKGKSEFYTIAGKTGTAQKYDPKIKALSNEKFYAWFAGFFPVDNPRYTIVIFTDEPKKIKRWEEIGGGAVSSTVLKNLINRLMFYSKIKPDKEVK